MALTLKASKRTALGKKNKALRRSGQIPAILYGHQLEPISLSLSALAFNRVLTEAGTSTLISVETDGDTRSALIHDIQFDPMTDQPIHADLFAVSMTEKLKAEIPLKFIGKSEAVDILEGTLVTNKDHIEVECLPQDLVHEIEIDLARLKTFDDVIHIKDLAIPKGIEVLDDLEETIVLVHPPKTKEELEAELAEPITEEISEIELSEDRGKETVEGEAAEGETTPEGQAETKEDKKSEKKEKEE